MLLRLSVEDCGSNKTDKTGSCPKGAEWGQGVLDLVLKEIKGANKVESLVYPIVLTINKEN